MVGAFACLQGYTVKAARMRLDSPTLDGLARKRTEAQKHGYRPLHTPRRERFRWDGEEYEQWYQELCREGAGYAT